MNEETKDAFNLDDLSPEQLEKELQGLREMGLIEPNPDYVSHLFMANQTRIQGRAGSVAIRGSWLIHPDEIVSVEQRGPNDFLLRTVDGQNYALVADEIALLVKAGADIKIA